MCPPKPCRPVFLEILVSTRNQQERQIHLKHQCSVFFKSGTYVGHHSEVPNYFAFVSLFFLFFFRSESNSSFERSVAATGSLNRFFFLFFSPLLFIHINIHRVAGANSCTSPACGPSVLDVPRRNIKNRWVWLTGNKRRKKKS